MLSDLVPRLQEAYFNIVDRTYEAKVRRAMKWALAQNKAGVSSKESGINIRRMKLDEHRNYVLFSTIKMLIWLGYNPHQKFLKGVIGIEDTRTGNVEFLVPAFRKFYNYGEPSEKDQYKKFLKAKYEYHYTKKEDGVNIRPWWNEATNRVEFATRGTLTGVVTAEQFGEEVSEAIDMSGGTMDFGELVRDICKEKYPFLLRKEYVQRYQMVFELIHPLVPIITNYGDAKELHLIGAFDNFRDMTYSQLRDIATSWNLTCVNTWDSEIALHGNFDDDLAALQAHWENTDQEGTVVTFCDDNSTVYRLKVKNLSYLKMLRLARYCSFKRTVARAKAGNLTTWDQFREDLFKEADMTEEIEMMYKQYFDQYLLWLNSLAAKKAEILAEYRKLPVMEGDDYRAKKKALASYCNAGRKDENPYFSYFVPMFEAELKGNVPESIWNVTAWDEEGKVWRNEGKINWFQTNLEKHNLPAK